MRKKILFWLTLPLMLVLFGFTSAESYTNFGVGFSVGNYDYLPYGHSSVGLSIDFNNYFNDYGNWVSVPRFGRCWRPYATSGWRPYLYGHWDYTSYGPTWEGYEPWAWAGYHYGNWVWTEEFGWVWIPGYDWHPGRVVWGYDSNAIGWMPAPPIGYSYGCGYLSYGNCGYSNPFYSPRFSSIGFNLFVFIDRHRYFNDNYADYYLGRDYARNVFVRRNIQIQPRAFERTQLERIVGRRIAESPVRVREIRMQNRTVRAVIPVGSEDRIRRNADRVVKQVIAPAIKDKRRFVEDRDRDFRNNDGDRNSEVRKSDRDREFDRGRELNRKQSDRDKGRDIELRKTDRDRQFENRGRSSSERERDLRGVDRNNRDNRLSDREREIFDRSRNERNDRRFEAPAQNERDRGRDIQRYEELRRSEQQRGFERRDTERRALEQREMERRDKEGRQLQQRDFERQRPEQPSQRFERNDRSDRENQYRGKENDNRGKENNSKKSEKKPKKVKN